MKEEENCTDPVVNMLTINTKNLEHKFLEKVREETCFTLFYKVFKNKLFPKKTNIFL